MNMHYEKLGRRLKLIVPRYRPNPISRSEDIPEKGHSTELKPIVGIGSRGKSSIILSLDGVKGAPVPQIRKTTSAINQIY